MLRTLLLLTAAALAGQKAPLTTDPRLLDRGRPGVSHADMLSRVTPAVVSVRLALEVSEADLRRVPVPNPRLVRRDPTTGKFLVPIALGSGVVVHPSGYIITNHHVVTAQGQVVSRVAMVQFADGRDLRGTLVGSDARTDIAVVKVDAKDLPSLRFADSDHLRVGDVVFAVGNPLDVGLSVSEGIVSGLGRNNLSLRGGPDYQDFIQTSAPINPGNSGGALVDAEGRLVGINTAVRADGAGIGYAVAGNLARFIAESLIERGTVVRGYIGAVGEDVPFAEAVRLGSPRGQGARVTQISEGSPAARAGLREGDLVTSVNAFPVAGWSELRLTISGFRPGARVDFSVIREGKSVVVRIPIEERPKGY